MNSPSAFPESTINQDDVVYPCKGCGEILEEGKAFELAGNRWHIDCFRCNTCGTLLDSDANLLLLGDGSLICNNCTYSCNACGNKIEDLAILTGEQAFCASCFRCRNCKNKIENLRYARTTQGIFCMSCHESLMQKRRKNRSKQKQAAAAISRNKALPEPPKSEAPKNGFAADSVDTPSDKHSEPDKLQDPTNAYSSSTRPSKSRQETSSSLSREVPSGLEDTKDNLTLPASTYQASQSATPTTTPKNPELTAAVYDPANELDGFYVPLVLDPNPASSTSPLANGREFSEPSASSKIADKSQRDYFPRASSAADNRPGRDLLNDPRQISSRSSSTDPKPSASPHIAYQEKGRLASENASDSRKRQNVSPSPRPPDSSPASPYPSSQGEFKLQEAPKRKKSGSKRNSKGETRSPSITSPIDTSSRNITPQLDLPVSTSPIDIDGKFDGYDRSPNMHPRSNRVVPMPQIERPRRGDSLAASAMARRDMSNSPAMQHIAELGNERRTSGGSSRHHHDGNAHMNGGMTISNPIESPGLPRNIYDSTSVQTDTKKGSGDAFTAPRHAPAPPSNHRTSGSNSTAPSDNVEAMSPSYTSRFMLTSESQHDDYSDERDHGLMRKMSNALKGHTRSVSDRVVSSPRSQKFVSPHSPLNGHHMISSPAASPEYRDEIVLKSQLRRAQQRISELESEKNNLQSIVNGTTEMKQVSTALKEKRSTVAELDTHREITVREVSVLVEHLKKHQETKKPFEASSFKSDVLVDLGESLNQLKASLTSEIEDLIQKRNDLNDDIANLIQMKDKGFQEYENLSNRNVQLGQHNKEIVQNIQAMMKANKTANGLGLSFGGQKEKNEHQSGNDLRQMMLDSSTTFGQDNDHETAAVITTPHVVKIKSQKPNMLRKGGLGKTLRGIRGALGTGDKAERTPTHPSDNSPYNGGPDAIGGAKTATEPRKFGGLFGGGDKGAAKHLRSLQNSSQPNLLNDSASPSQLFGSDLAARCNFEGQNIPAIVIRCIQEVETRGMDVEGIYRKSGGSGQVNTLKAGFEKNNDHDIGDPELEIHAVTSCLKQYFRRLPVPLITFDIYDEMLDASRVEGEERKAAKMREAVGKLPKAHKDCLEFLIFHLAKVPNFEQYNLMTPLNLAVVFAPTIMRPASIEREMLDMQLRRQTVQTLIEMSKDIFVSA